MSAGFTPGPWSVRGLNIYADQRIATGSFLSRGSREQDVAESTANAHLIATAPALYKALVDAQQRECSSWCDPSLNEHTRYCKAQCAALAKARGDLVDPLEQVKPQ